MKFNISLYKKFITPRGVLIFVSILLLSISSLLLFDGSKKTIYQSKAYINDTWVVSGDNSSGQFCNGTTVSDTSPSQFLNSTDVASVSGGVDHVLALKNDGTIKSCGNNAKGQLGIGNTTSKTSLENITSLTGIVQVVAGNKVSYALKNTGVVYQWGDTISGDLNTPIAISGLTDIKSITTSENTLLAIDSTSTLYAYGKNTNGESGNGNTNNITTAQNITAGVSFAKCAKEACAIVKSGNVYTAGNNTKKELADDLVTSRSAFAQVNIERSPTIKPLTGITTLASGPTSYNFYALDNTGVVWTWGSADHLGYTLPLNADGDLAAKITSFTTTITDISGSYPLARSADSTLYTWTNTSPTLVPNIVSTTKINQSSGQTFYAKANLYNPLTTTDIQTLNPTCDPGEVNDITDCTFILPTTKDLPNDFGMAVGNYDITSTCTQSLVPNSTSISVKCVDVSIGPVPGINTIFAKLGTGAATATLGKLDVKKTIINNDNLADLGGTCDKATISQGQSLTCTFPLVLNTAFDLPPNGLRAAITNISGDKNSIIGPSSSCTILENTQTSDFSLVCTNIPSVIGTKIADLGTHQIIVYDAAANNYYYNKASVTVDSIVIGSANIVTSTDCISSNTVQLGNTYNCTFALTGSPSNSYALPVGGITAKTSTGTNSSALCTLLNNGSSGAKLSCNGIPTLGSTRGVQNVLLKFGTVSNLVKGGVTIQENTTGDDLSNLNLNCSNARVNSTTICTFDIPQFTTNYQISIAVGDVTPGGTCSANGNVATCINVPTGPEKGNQVIYAQLPPSAKVNTGKIAELTKIYQNSSITSANFNCLPQIINATTSCTFDFLPYEVLDPAFGIRIGNSEVVNTCTVNNLLVTCTGVKTGSESGDQAIYAGTTSQVDTGKVVFISRNLLTSDLSNFSQLVGLTCLPNPVAVYSATTCVGILPKSIQPGNSIIKLKINGESEVTCTISGQNIRCENLNAGSTTGVRNIQVSLNSGTFENSGLFVTVSGKVIGDTELSSLGDPTKTQIFSQFQCGINGVVYAGKTTTCTIQLAPGWVIFPELKASIEVDPPTGKCTQNGTTITCVSVPVVADVTKTGALFLVNKSGNTILTGSSFSVKAAPADFVYVPPVDPVLNPATNPSNTGTQNGCIPNDSCSSGAANSSNTGTSTSTSSTSAVAQPNSSNTTATPRTGGINIPALILMTISWAILFYAAFIKRKNISK
jgi:alpha-tubulin suppressor-like RCC1 family protein